MPIQIQSHEVELVLQGTTERIDITITDDRGKPIDPTALKLTILNTGNVPVSTDILYPAADINRIPARIKRSGKGRFYFPFGEDSNNGLMAAYANTSGTAPIPPWNVTTGNQLKLAIDSKPWITITITGANPAAITPLELVNSINSALVADANYGEKYGKVAFVCDDPILVLVSPERFNPINSRIQIDGSIPLSAHQNLFGPIPTMIDVKGPITSNIALAAILSNTTTSTGDYLFHWQAEAFKGAENISLVQIVKVHSPQAFGILPYFRLELDKALKVIGVDKARVGYTDAQLMSYLTLAISEINSYQPITGFTIDTFPINQFRMMVIWTALLIALISQGLFAIDTDIDYSDRGASFRIEHSGKIQSLVGMISSRLQQTMPQFKLAFAHVGTVKIEAGANYRLGALMNAAPTGALFRGIFSR